MLTGNPPFGIPDGEVKVEAPDGVLRPDGTGSAYDPSKRLNNPSYDINTRRSPQEGGKDPTS
jgi:hypothetical protein